VQDIQVEEHLVFITSSQSGWTNNELGLAWLKQVFKCFTREKARYKCRLLILDDYGSHLTMDFIEYCYQQRILLAVFPPHSTHSLQLLDVVMFKPLSSAYSHSLTTYLHKSQGLLPLKKGDFFLLFWDFWITSFKKETILKSFEATEVWPKEREKILQKFRQENQEARELEANSCNINTSSWRKIRGLIQSVVQGGAEKEAKQLTHSLHNLEVQNELLHHENQGLRQALTTKTKHKKKGKALSLQQEGEYHGGAVLWSPKKVKKARECQNVIDQEKEEEQLQKAQARAAKAAEKLHKLQIAEEKRVTKEAAKMERGRVKAQKAYQQTECTKLKQAQNQPRKQARQGTKRALSKASKPAPNKQRKVAVAEVQVEEAAPAALPKHSSRGRKITTKQPFEQI
jgi:hypothetical protein